MPHYSKSSTQRNYLSIRLTDEENLKLNQLYQQYPTDASRHAFYKAILLGLRVHPDFEDLYSNAPFPQNIVPLFSQSEYTDQWLRHYLCQAVAGLILLQNQPGPFRDAIVSNPKHYTALLTKLREYEFGDNGEVVRKSPEELGMVRR